MAATRYNAAEASLWLNNFDETDRLLARFRLMALSRHNTSVNQQDAMPQDQCKRFKANR